MSRIAIIVPGIGYTVDRSLLYFAGKVAEQIGYRRINIEFSGFEQGVKGDPKKMKRAFSHAYDQLIEQLPPIQKGDDVLFISKSIGTAASLKADTEKDIRAKHILFTPLMETMELLEELLQNQGKSRHSDIVVFHGLADPWATDNENMKRMADEVDVDYCEIPDANHSLETGNPIVDMDSQKRTMEICQRFLNA